MCGIFAYLNHLVPKKREEILSVLVNGLRRMEYRGYDSAGLAVDGADEVLLVRKTGKVAVLADSIKGLPVFLILMRVFRIERGSGRSSEHPLWHCAHSLGDARLAEGRELASPEKQRVQRFVYLRS